MTNVFIRRNMTNRLQRKQKGSDHDCLGVVCAEKDGDGGGATGDVVEGGASGFGLKKKHGILVMLGWGVLMPIGMMMARYFKQFDPFWFYSHISIQGIGFLLGVLGIIFGFKLDDDEGEGDIDTHKNLGIFILVFGCLQVYMQSFF